MAGKGESDMMKIFRTGLIAAGVALATAATSGVALADDHGRGRQQWSRGQNGDGDTGGGSHGSGNGGPDRHSYTQVPIAPRNSNGRARFASPLPSTAHNAPSRQTQPVTPSFGRNEWNGADHDGERHDFVRRDGDHDSDRDDGRKPAPHVISVPPPSVMHSNRDRDLTQRRGDDRDHDRVADRSGGQHVAPVIRHRDQRPFADRDRDRYRERERARDRYIAQNWYWSHDIRSNWEHDRSFGWVRYDQGRFGQIRRYRPVYYGYGSAWMWWGGAYDPFNAPYAFADCYPVVQFGYWEGRRAELGGTMCYDAIGPYVLPNSVFVIALI
jgi:hypothetical protein